MTQLHLKRGDVLKTKGRIQPPFFNTDLLPQHEKEQLNERLSQILTDKGEDKNENS